MYEPYALMLLKDALLGIEKEWGMVSLVWCRRSRTFETLQNPLETCVVCNFTLCHNCIHETEYLRTERRANGDEYWICKKCSGPRVQDQ